MVTWNDGVRLIFSDVDETVADLYTAATPDMCRELERLLEEGRVLFFITGQSVQSMQWRITDHIRPELRARVLMGHCSGAEVWGFDSSGRLLSEPFYSLYKDALTVEQQQVWRNIVQQVIREFKLQVFPATPLATFKAAAGDNPLAIMLEDRGPQITFEVVNGYDLSPEQERELEVAVPSTHGNLDLRVPLLERLDVLLQEAGLPISPRLAGVFAIDLAIKGVSKTTAIHKILENGPLLQSLGVDGKGSPQEYMEVWGDKFSVIRGGTDRHISEALPKEVRSISFREENPEEFLPGYNTVVWSGEQHLHEGLLEFLKARHS